MLLLQAFLKGFSIAFYIVVPIGALSILCIKRSLQKGFKSGLASSLGVITTETIYAIAAIYGITIISKFVIEWKFYMQLCGLLVMTLIGFRIATSKIKSSEIPHLQKQNGLWKDYLSTVVITFVNPLTLIGFIAVFATIGIHGLGDSLDVKLMMLLGFIFMTTIYNLILIFSSLSLKKKFISKDSKISNDLQLINMLHQISGVVIIFFSFVTFIFSLIKD
jgi:threonine/homoserine/homoserine lactone efflux protein